MNEGLVTKLEDQTYALRWKLYGSPNWEKQSQEAIEIIESMEWDERYPISRFEILFFASLDNSFSISREFLLVLIKCFAKLLDPNVFPRSKIFLKQISLLCDHNSLPNFYRYRSHELMCELYTLIGRLPNFTTVVCGLFDSGCELIPQTLGMISKLYMATDSDRSFTGYSPFKLFWEKQADGLHAIGKTMVRDVGFVGFDYYTTTRFIKHGVNFDSLVFLTRPRDNVMIANDIINNWEKNNVKQYINLHCRAIDVAYIMRKQINLLHNFEQVIHTLLLGMRFSQGCSFYNLSKNVLGLIIDKLHPCDWEVTNLRSRKRRLTIKNPKWAKQVIEIYRSNILAKKVRCRGFDKSIAFLEENYKRLKKQKQALEREIDEYPSRIMRQISEQRKQEKRKLEGQELFSKFIEDQINKKKKVKK